MTDPQPPDERGRAIELEVEVPGTVEEVWEAVATGPGITSWFIPMDVEERAGGEVVMDWGSFGRETADVVAWEAPHRVVFRGRDEQSLAFEWLVEARGGGSCVVRLVNSGFGEGEEWDGQYHGMSQGWKIFLANLRLQLTHFRGRRAHAAIPTVVLDGPRPAAWARLLGELGIATDARPGDRVSTSGDAPALAGVVEEVVDGPGATAYLLVLDAPAPGTAFLAAEGDGDQVAGSAYLYLYGDDVADAGAAWTSWLGERFPAMGVEDVADPSVTWAGAGED